MPYSVYECTPGYMPDNPASHFREYDPAIEYAKSLAEELEEQGYPAPTCTSSGPNFMRWTTCRDERDLGREIVLSSIPEEDFQPDQD